MTRGMGSIYVRKALGKRLRALRLAAGKTLADMEDVASIAKLKRIEAGEPPIKMADVRTLCFMYGADAATTEQLAEMSLNKEEDWWETYNDIVPTWLGKYVALESMATSLTTFDPDLIHGLLQTPAYHGAVYNADPSLPPGDLDRQLTLRAERQRTAFQKEPALKIRTVLGEGALVRVVGDEKVMVEQRVHLLEMATQRHVEVLVLPWKAGAYAGMQGSYTILGVDDSEDPDVVYLETLSGARYIENQNIVDRYRRIAAAQESKSVPLKEFLS